MRAVWITRIGGPEVLAVRETPSPLPGPGEILVRVRASSVGFAEVMARQGTYPLAPKPPCIVGYDASGIVEAHGTGVNAPPIGARVMVICHFGAQAEMVVAPARFALRCRHQRSCRWLDREGSGRSGTQSRRRRPLESTGRSQWERSESR